MLDVADIIFRQEHDDFRGMGDLEVEERIEGRNDLYVRPTQDKGSMLTRLTLDPLAAEMVREDLPCAWPLRELVDVSRLDKYAALRLVLALERMKLLEFVESEGPSGKRNRAERQVRKTLLIIKRRSLFEAMHAHWSSHPAELKRGYEQLLSELSEDRYREVLDDRLEKVLKEGTKQAERLWSKVGDQARRNAMRLEFATVSQLHMAADMYVKQGGMARFRQDWTLAKFCFESALDFDLPDSAGKDIQREARRYLQEISSKVGSSAELSNEQLKELRSRLTPPEEP